MHPEGFDATSEDVASLVSATFDVEEHDLVRAVLADLTTVSERENPARLQVAALLVADGSLDELGKAVDLGRVDWRDLLVAAFYPGALHLDVPLDLPHSPDDTD